MNAGRVYRLPVLQAGACRWNEMDDVQTDRPGRKGIYGRDRVNSLNDHISCYPEKGSPTTYLFCVTVLMQDRTARLTLCHGYGTREAHACYLVETLLAKDQRALNPVNGPAILDTPGNAQFRSPQVYIVLVDAKGNP